jgi:hypothetical protein
LCRLRASKPLPVDIAAMPMNFVHQTGPIATPLYSHRLSIVLKFKEEKKKGFNKDSKCFLNIDMTI